MDTSTVEAAVSAVGRRKVRRQYTLEQKRHVVAETNAPGTSIAQVARRHGINANLLFNWRRQEQRGVLEQHTRGVKLLPVLLSDPPAPTGQPEVAEPPVEEGRIEIVLAQDVRITIIGAVAVERLEQLLTILRRTS